MESRLKKPLSLKQRKIAFQSVPTEKKPALQIPQANSICKEDKTTELEADNQVHGSSHEHDPLPNSLANNGLHFSGLCNLGFYTSVVNIESSVRDESDSTSTCTLSCLLAKLWQRMSHKEHTVSKPSNKVKSLSATKPDEFLAKLREENQVFNNRAQHDAQEMLRYLLSNLHETYAIQEAPPPTSPAPLRIDTNPNPTPTSLKNGTLKSIPTKRRLSTHNTSSKYIKLNSGRGIKMQTLNSFFNPSQASPTPVAVAKEIKQPSQLIPGIFQGSLAYETHCFECENTTRRSEHFLDISVPVSTAGFPGFPPLSSPVKTPSFFGASVVGSYSLSWCLSQFALREKLRGDNKYRCDECGRFTEAERSLLFSELPRVMTIHLNRFVAQAWGHSSRGITVSKIGGNVAVPMTLRFKPWTTEDCKGRDKVYGLFAIVFHSGSSCTSGHYTACVRVCEAVEATCEKDPVERFYNSWLYFDDEVVELLSQNELCSMLSPLSEHSSTAYILFYACQ